MCEQVPDHGDHQLRPRRVLHPPAGPQPPALPRPIRHSALDLATKEGCCAGHPTRDVTVSGLRPHWCAQAPNPPHHHTSRHKAQSFSHSCPHLCPRRAAVADETGCGQGRLAGDVQNLQALLKIAFPIIYGRLFAYGLSRVRPPSPLPPAPFGLAEVARGATVHPRFEHLPQRPRVVTRLQRKSSEQAAGCVGGYRISPGWRTLCTWRRGGCRCWCMPPSRRSTWAEGSAAWGLRVFRGSSSTVCWCVFREWMCVAAETLHVGMAADLGAGAVPCLMFAHLIPLYSLPASI